MPRRHAPVRGVTLDGVVVEGDPLGPEGGREGLPEEGVEGHGAEKADEQAAQAGGQDDAEDGEASSEKEVEGDGPD